MAHQNKIKAHTLGRLEKSWEGGLMVGVVAQLQQQLLCFSVFDLILYETE